MTVPRLEGSSRLSLAPFVVKGKGDHYCVIHRHGRQALSTSRAGVQAIRLLAAGRSVQQAQEVLGRRYGLPAAEIDLAPLLGSLFASGFVRLLDGRPVAAAGEPGPHRLRVWLTLLVGSPLLELALKRLPLRLALPIVYRWLGRGSDHALEDRVAANLRRAPRLNLAPGEIARIVADNRQSLRKQHCDRLLLGSLPRHRARRWLAREIEVSGLEHLTRALASGRGAILCSFHMGSYGLIPFVLGARGVAVTMYAGFGEDARADVAAWLAERAARHDSYPVRITGGVMGLRVLLRSLARGETVLLYCDRALGEAGSAGSVARSPISVPFLGTRIWSARGLGWLHRETGATVLPAVLLWEGRRRHHLHIGSAITGEHGAGAVRDISAVMVRAFGALEGHVRRHPGQWLKWGDFGTMVAD